MSVNLISATTLRAVTPHTILSETFMALQQKIKSVEVDAETLELLEKCEHLIVPLEQYLETHTSLPSSALQRLEEKTNAQNWDTAFEKEETDLHLEKEMLSGAVEGQFLKFITAISKAKRVLEIGSFTGYASLAIAEALPEDGLLIACEYDRFTAEFARNQLDQSQHGKKVEIRVGDAMQSIKELSNELAFDLVFIDADKQGYTDYYTYLLETDLIKVGGVICVDNTLYQGQVYNPNYTTDNGEALKKFNALVADDNRVQQVLLPLRDGVTMVRRIA